MKRFRTWTRSRYVFSNSEIPMFFLCSIVMNIRCPFRTWPYSCIWRCNTLRFPKLQHYWSPIIKMFNVICRILFRGILTLSRDAVGAFYSPNRLGQAFIDVTAFVYIYIYIYIYICVRVCVRVWERERERERFFYFLIILSFFPIKTFLGAHVLWYPSQPFPATDTKFPAEKTPYCYIIINYIFSSNSPRRTWPKFKSICTTLGHLS